MSKFQDLMDQLNSFDTSDEIASFLLQKGIKGDMQDSDSCPITNWFLTETDAVGCTTTEAKITIEDIDYNSLEFVPSETVSMFIKQFDDGHYPDLVNECTCDGCMPYYEYGY